jgi:hypothetical protein
MAEVSLNFDELNVPELIALGSRLCDGLAGNPNFPEPAPPLDSLKEVLQELKSKQDRYAESRLRLNDLKLDRDGHASRLKGLLVQVANYVQDASGGDSKKIMSANLHFEHETDLWPFNDPEQVLELSATSGDKPGEIDLAWDPVREADGYEIEFSRESTAPVTWHASAATSQSKTTLTELASGLRLWFRVRAVSTKGVGPWSDPVTKYVP